MTGVGQCNLRPHRPVVKVTTGRHNFLTSFHT